jgi:hypothetical protein
MGLIRPPWISKSWFIRYPFNYCDHFGDKKILAKVCVICKEDLKTGHKDIKQVLKQVGRNLAKTIKLVRKDAKAMGIDIDNLQDMENEPDPDPNTNVLYRIVCKYGEQIDIFRKLFEFVPQETNVDLLSRVIDVLDHSRFYMISKIRRALSNDDLEDSKTSAFLAYIAVERNSRALLALSRHRPLCDHKMQILLLAENSLNVITLIQEEFFPDEILEYEEFGYYDFLNVY